MTRKTAKFACPTKKKYKAENDIQSALKLLAPALSVFIHFYASSDPDEDDSGKILRGSLQPKTDDLLKIISPETLSELLSMYRILTLAGHAKKYRNRQIKFPLTKLNKISKVLDELKADGWLTKGKADALFEKLKLDMVASEKGTDYIFHKIFKRNTVPNNPSNRPIDDPAFILFVVLLIDLLVAKDKDGKMHVEMVLGFISEQILNAEEDAEIEEAIISSQKPRAEKNEAITEKREKDISRRAIELCYSRNRNKKQALIELINRQADSFRLLLDLPIQTSHPLGTFPTVSYPTEDVSVKSSTKIHPDKLNELLHLFFEK